MRIVAILGLAASGGGAEPAFADGWPSPVELERQFASDMTFVMTTAGRTFSGRLDGFREGRLHLRLATDGGEVGYSFAPEEIARLDLPGTELESQALELFERNMLAQAGPLLEALARQRVRYLPVLNAVQRRVLLAFVEANEATDGDAYATIGFVGQLRPLVSADDERRLLGEALITAYLRLELADEARRLAEAWCADADPAGPSVLGWSALARLACDQGDFERALWVALQPVVFAGPLPARHLDECFALAVHAARRLGRTGEAEMLLREMDERGLEWPAAARFAPITPGLPDDTAPAARDLPASSPGPRAPPRGTLGAVCKLTGRAEP